MTSAVHCYVAVKRSEGIIMARKSMARAILAARWCIEYTRSEIDIPFTKIIS